MKKALEKEFERLLKSIEHYENIIENDNFDSHNEDIKYCQQRLDFVKNMFSHLKEYEEMLKYEKEQG